MTSISLSVAKHKPPAIVREILQNSLDAAKNAGRKCARVLFSLESVDVDDIPGIVGYKNALEKCEAFWRTRSKHTQAMEVLGGIRRRLEQKSVPALFVCDNGIGLDTSRMEAILSDGVSDQDSSGATGSHGNGHFTVFNLSGLRYLLYGGISKENGRLASGHATLCSHQGDQGACSKNGYFAVQITGDLENPFVFPSNGDIPKVIADKLDEIASKEKTGTMLAALGFNYFGDDKKYPDIADLILGVAARNFFVAVAQDELVVAVKTDKGERTLNASNLWKTMEESQEIPNTSSFPTHNTSQRFYRLFDDAVKKQGEAKGDIVKTDGCSMRILYRQHGVATTKIALCRNGMWITNNVPLVGPGDFAKHAAFEALLLCDASDPCGDLVRMAEGNLHNELKLMSIEDKQERQKLRKIFQGVRSHLQSAIEEQDEESFGFVALEGAGRISVSETAGRITPSKERIRPIGPDPAPDPNPIPPDPDPNPKPPNPNPNPRPSRPKQGKALSVQHVAVRKGDKMDIRIRAMEESPEVELRLVRSGGGDFSCDNPAAEDKHISISRVVCNGGKCDVDDSGVARIGKIDKDEEKIIHVEFHAPKVQGHYRVDYEFIRRNPSP